MPYMVTYLLSLRVVRNSLKRAEALENIIISARVATVIAYRCLFCVIVEIINLLAYTEPYKLSIYVPQTIFLVCCSCCTSQEAKGPLLWGAVKLHECLQYCKYLSFPKFIQCRAFEDTLTIQIIISVSDGVCDTFYFDPFSKSAKCWNTISAVKF